MSQATPNAPSIRRPYVAGHFYPGDAAGLLRDVEACLVPADSGARPARGAIVPHAGYMYSGAVAGTVYATAALPQRLILLGPNHTGLGRPIAVMNRGGWETPLGIAPIDETLADLILDAAEVLQEDEAAHRAEHSIEVQIPFLQVRLREFAFVPICIGTGKHGDLVRLATGIADAIEALGEPVGVIISSDMTHYEPAGIAREKDFAAIRKIETLDGEGLHRVVREKDISMCGYAPATCGLHLLRKLGASRADLVAYANSGDTSGNHMEVVGYAGLLIP